MPDSLSMIRLEDRPVVHFGGGATYRAIIGDDTGEGLPIRTGVQVSPPGYQTRIHSHPYVETLTVLEGRGEVWLDGDDDTVPLEPGITVAIPAHRKHGFRALGDKPLVTLGIHMHTKRIADYVSVDDSRKTLSRDAHAQSS
jgi:mannose-6-phosphate isomerase-like protein (cupin superfamily)